MPPASPRSRRSRAVRSCSRRRARTGRPGRCSRRSTATGPRSRRPRTRASSAPTRSACASPTRCCAPPFTTPRRRASAGRRIARSRRRRRRPGASWHLAVAATAPDERLAAALERLAHEAGGRGAPATAAVALERAARLSPDPAAGAARTLAAAHMATLGGQPERARALLDRLLPTVADPATRADVQLLRGIAMLQVGRPMEAHALLDAEAERIAPVDPARAAGLLTQAGVALMAHGTVERLAALAERARRSRRRSWSSPPALLRVQALTALGEHGEARALLAAREPALAASTRCSPATRSSRSRRSARSTWRATTGPSACSAGSCGRPRARRRGGARPAARGRRHAAPAPRAPGRGRRGRHRGRVAGGGPRSTGSCTRSRWPRSRWSPPTVAKLPGAGRRPTGCSCSARELELTSTLACAEQALGLLALSGGDADAAVRHLARARAHTAELGTRDPGFLFTPPTWRRRACGPATRPRRRRSRTSSRPAPERPVAPGRPRRRRAAGRWSDDPARSTSTSPPRSRPTRACRCRSSGADPALLRGAAAPGPAPGRRARRARGRARRASSRSARRRWAARAAHELAAAGGAREDARWRC